MNSESQCNVENRTIFLHDNLEILQGINSACLDLIYLDPPFNKNKKFTAPKGSSAEGAEFSDIFREEDVKDDWLRTIKEDHVELYQYLNGIKDVGKSYNYAYLAYMAIRLIECRRILKSTGSLYLHCDPTMSHYLKTTLDCIFGEDKFRNEIIWSYRTGGSSSTRFSRKHDVLLYYCVSNEKLTFNVIKEKSYTKAKSRKAGVINYGGGTAEFIEDENGVFNWVNCRDVWEMSYIGSTDTERTGYPTQKPLALLDRIIKASSNEGDTVLDPFLGCGTTCIAAEKVGRQWIGIDVSQRAYDLVKIRLDKEVAHPHEHPTERQEVHLKASPPKRTDLGSSIRETKFVYVISHPKYPGDYKVGIAKNVKARLNAYQTSDPERRYQVEFAHETHLFREIEQHVHTHFDNRYEWVSADLYAIKQEILSYTKTS